MKNQYELKPCPFCNAINSDVGVILHTDSCYLMLKYMNAKKDRLIKAWNTRPIEDALRAEIARLKAVNHIKEADESMRVFRMTVKTPNGRGTYQWPLPDGKCKVWIKRQNWINGEYPCKGEIAPMIYDESEIEPA